MQTKHLIQTSANVISITNLVKGNVVKIIEDRYSEPEISYGVVIDLMNTGSKTFIEMLVYKKSYSSVDAKVQVYSGEKDINFFPADPNEVKEYLNETLESIQMSIKQDKENLQKKIEAYEKAKEFVSGELSKKLLETSFVEISQVEYDKRVEERQKLLEQTF